MLAGLALLGLPAEVAAAPGNEAVAAAAPPAVAGAAPAVRAVPAQPARPAGAVGAARQVTPTVRYQPPVDAPVVDPFRPPSTPYGPGNRGWEYATVPGSPIRAAAAGEVVFAGRVGPASAVTIRHADGLRTSYSLLAEVVVAEGATVAGGQEVGRSAARFHFGVRRGETYLDPATLFAAAPELPRPRPRLVPLLG